MALPSLRESSLEQAECALARQAAHRDVPLSHGGLEPVEDRVTQLCELAWRR